MSELRYCDECGRVMIKAHRVYKGHRYCSTCYARVFKRRACPKCGNYARLPAYAPESVCRKCENDKPCIRCGKKSYAVGKVTRYGPVCNACAPYFREKEECEVCGVLSSRLSRVKSLGNGRRVCPRCARFDHGTCDACHRYRRIHVAQNGKSLCNKCLELGEVPCPVCSELMPAGLGIQCHRCYWKKLLEKRIAIDSAAFSTTQMAEHFRAFGLWLGGEVGEHKAGITVHRYLPFFVDIETKWKGIPNYNALLSQFGAKTLRRSLLPMRWMEASGLVVIDQKAKEEDTERRMIMSILDKFAPGSDERTVIDGYHNLLLKKLMEGKTQLRSVRLALSPAGALLQLAGNMGSVLPEKKSLKAYLDKFPGQRAAVTGFVGYLRDIHGVKLFMPNKNSRKLREKGRKKLNAKMLSMMREGGEGKKFERQWLSVALSYFHGLPINLGIAVPDENISVCDDGGVTVLLDGKRYWIPNHTDK